jgi:hypothetical protein
MPELVSRARDVVHIFEGEEVSAATDYFSERIRSYLDQGWSLEDHIRDVWRPALDDLAGSPRRISEEKQVSTTAVRFTLEGDRGRAFVTISFDPDGGVGGFGIERHVFEGIGNLVIMCPYERVAEMDAFYNSLLGQDRWRVPRFAFGEADEYHREPRWGDSDYPQQLHLDIFVQDLRAAESIALQGGADLLVPSADAIRPQVLRSGDCSRHRRATWSDSSAGPRRELPGIRRSLRASVLFMYARRVGRAPAPSRNSKRPQMAQVTTLPSCIAP